MTSRSNYEHFKELDEFIDALPDKKNELIRVLHHAQNIYGYLPQDLQVHIAKKMEISTTKVFGIVSFYSFFSTKPKGEYDVSVCLGPACYIRGANKIIDEFKKELGIEVGETTDDGKFSLSTLRCNGACSLAPVVLVNGKIYERVTESEIKTIIDQYRHKN